MLTSFRLVQLASSFCDESSAKTPWFAVWIGLGDAWLLARAEVISWMRIPSPRIPSSQSASFWFLLHPLPLFLLSLQLEYGNRQSGPDPTPSGLWRK